jgi:hypothetical protein
MKVLHWHVLGELHLGQDVSFVSIKSFAEGPDSYGIPQTTQAFEECEFDRGSLRDFVSAVVSHV